MLTKSSLSSAILVLIHSCLSIAAVFAWAGGPAIGGADKDAGAVGAWAPACSAGCSFGGTG